ncbi:cytosine deaminase-like metal-dependent hydrolase [Thermanaerovibrio velox DSM 12556]|uniref:Cytosine deaminase-like metal-dependent hydrolase n=1 Tax=Thermanaerovibrio velox DSM 12556 TaxID=926567 RepID=H0UN67_9BACT|nr:amidohydrolase family protein [Thermanaerovibrio velox]EHM10352.1 cytosine deaminase-like metal-dependent hydrolase [Thermanaerovibrio velox DSM 12556]
MGSDVLIRIDGRPVAAVKGGFLVDPLEVPLGDSTVERIEDYQGGFSVMPGDFNGHSHPEQSVYAEMVEEGWDLPTWCRRTIYAHSVHMTPELVYLSCCRAFGRMLLNGITSVAVSFYCHNRMGNALDREVIKAALDSGIRILFGRMNYDLVSKEAYPEKRASQESYFEGPYYENHLISLMEEFNGLAEVQVAPSLHSFHANTLGAVARVLELASELGSPLQFHLSEDKGDVDLCLDLYGERPVFVLARLLERTGPVRLLLSDCIWLSQEEKDLLAQMGASVVLNLRMNHRMGVGLPDVRGLLERGIPVYLGTDGEASNYGLSIQEEREFALEQFGVSVPIVPFDMRCGNVGSMELGSLGDLKVLNEGRVWDVFVGGRKVVSRGTLLTMDLNAVEERIRYITSDWNVL